MSQYAKFFVAVVGAAVIAVQDKLADDVIARDEWFAIGVAVLTALGVFLFPNKPSA